MKNGRPEKLKINLPNNEKSNVTRPCLVAACRGNDNIADLLNYLLYEADEIAKKLKDDADLSAITLQLSHDKMLNRPNNEGKRFNFSERSLIGYLGKLDEWKLVTTGKYGRSQVVHITAINAAIANPPVKPKGKPRGKRKSGNVEANKPSAKSSTSAAKENVELKLKVDMLQEKVDLLQLKVDMFQEFVEMFQLSKSSKSASQAQAEAKKVSVDIIDTVYTIDFFTGAYCRIDEEDSQQAAEEKKSTEPSQIAYSHKTETNHASLETHTNTVEVARAPGYKQTTTIDTPSQVLVGVTQVAPPTAEPVPLLPPEPKPARQHTFGNLREGLNERGVNQPLTKTQQKAIDDAAKREEESRIKGREEDLWRMAERISGVVVETTYATKDVKAMAKSKMPLEDIEIIMQKYADAGLFDLTKIANYLPTYAARKQRKQNQDTGNITPFPNRFQQPQQEVRIVKPNDASHYGTHLDASKYAEEPIRATR